MNFALRFEVFHLVSEGIHKHLIIEDKLNEALKGTFINLKFISIMRISPFILDAPLKSYYKKSNSFVISNQLDYGAYLDFDNTDRFLMIKHAILETIRAAENLGPPNSKDFLIKLYDITNNLELRSEDR